MDLLRRGREKQGLSEKIIQKRGYPKFYIRTKRGRGPKLGGGGGGKELTGYQGGLCVFQEGTWVHLERRR